ncbi:MAG: response regulator [Caldilineaceae bacterium]
MPGNLRVLLVDDNKDDYASIRNLLWESHAGQIEVEWVTNYAAALTVMAENHHDIYLLKYCLGAETGLDLLQSALAAHCQGPIIVLSDQNDRMIDVDVMQAGASDYLVKGELTATLLERSIRYALRQKQIQADLAEAQQRLLDSRENERAHLAHRLHEGPLQDLIGMRFYLGAVIDVVKDEQARDQLGFVQENLQSVIEAMRLLCVDLRPPALGPFGLEKAIRAAARRFHEQAPAIEVALDLDEDGQQLPERVRLALYRIFQQALSNVQRHSQASHVRISLRLLPYQVQLRIRDDGIGFTPPPNRVAFSRQGQVGLLEAAEHAAAIGGHLEVQSTPGNGALVMVHAPLPAEG